MKKKGLIVSTIVMVLVLVVALSTATFAWFSATSSAKIENLTVNTVSATGLQIGTYVYSGGAGNYYSGGVELNGENKWTSETKTVGNIVTFDASTGGLKTGFFGASGDGLNMYAAGALSDKIETAVLTDATTLSTTSVMYGYKDADKSYTKLGVVDTLTDKDGKWLKTDTNATDAEITAMKNSTYDSIHVSNGQIATENAPGSINADGSPATIMIATENKSYFAVDLAVKLTEQYADASNGALILKQFDILGTKYMAAASRVALFAYKADGTTSGAGTVADLPGTNYTSTPLVNGDAVFVAEPYGATAYAGGWSNTAAAATSTSYISAPGTADGNGLYPYAGVTKAQLNTIYTDSFFFDKSDLTAATVPTIGIEQIKAGTTFAGKNVQCGTFSADNQTIFLRLVIWFEGEDAQCVSAFANNTGFGLNLEFATAAKNA